MTFSLTNGTLFMALINNTVCEICGFEINYAPAYESILDYMNDPRVKDFIIGNKEISVVLNSGNVIHLCGCSMCSLRKIRFILE